jgi:hypothetical protein
MVLACWQTNIVDELGNLVGGATVQVNSEAAGAPLASLFSDRAGAVPLGNPFTATAAGFAQFFVLSGEYKITITKGAFTQTFRYVPVDRGVNEMPSPGLNWLFSTSTSDADPGTGNFKFNNATLASVTTLYIDNSALVIGDVTAYLDSWDDTGDTGNRGTITIKSIQGDAIFIGKVTGTVVNGTGYRKVSVTPIVSIGTFDAGAELSVEFFPTGNTGATGPSTQGKHSVFVAAPSMWKNNSAAGPSQGQFAIVSANVNYLAFDPTTLEDAFFTLATPKSWNLGNITIRFYWLHSATVTNFAVLWQAYIAAYSDNEAITGSTFAQIASLVDTGGTTNNLYISAESTGTSFSGATTFDFLNFIIRRLGSDGTDTLAVDALLLGVLVTYVTNADTDN